MAHSFFTADVFTSTPFGGASIPVFPDASQLTESQRQAIANELNASHTVFLQPTDQASLWQIETYTPHKSVPVYPHVVLAAAHVLAKAEQSALKDAQVTLDFVTPEQRQFSAAVNLTEDQPSLISLSLSVRSTVDRYVPTREEIANILSLIPADIGFDQFVPLTVSCQAPYLIVPIKSYNALREAKFDLKAWNQSSAPASLINGILLFSNNTDPNVADFYSRLMGQDIGILEDPPVAPVMSEFVSYLCDHAHIQKGTHVFSMQRGAKESRQSVIQLEMDNKGEKDLTMRIGGEVITVWEGQLNI